jgi:hypothetical protein
MGVKVIMRKKGTAVTCFNYLKKHYGSNYFEVAKALVNLANAFAYLVIHKKGGFLERALPILEKHYGTDKFEVLKP